MTVRGITKRDHSSSADTRTRTPQSVTLEDVIIGRDVLELISSAMYVDPMTIYREYVQNAADAVDEAKRQGVLGEGEVGRVDIAVNISARSVRIRDNGCGINWSSFARRLTALGASPKRGTASRGFRGVGRLSGLGYAQELIFRSRVAEEDLVSELRWDCRRLKATFRSAEVDSGIAFLIRDVVTVQRVDGDGYPERFFEVEIRGLVRFRNDRLMNPIAIAEYLSQVAPVPFAPNFRFGSEISAALRSTVGLGDLHIFVEGVEGPIYRPHRDQFSVDEKRTITFDSVEILEVPAVDGQMAAVAWVLHHDYEGAIPTETLCKGLRLRSGNIQVGDHALLEDLFQEPRFNVWCVGEVHVIDRKIVPNGRRDHFEQNSHFYNLTNYLTPTARDIARRCRTSSIRRKWLREFDLHRRSIKEKLEIVKQGSLPKAKRDALIASIEPALLQMEKIAGMAALIDDHPDELRAEVQKLRKHAAAAANREVSENSPLMALPRDRRLIYEQLFGLVYDCSVNRIAAKALVDRMLDRLRTNGDEIFNTVKSRSAPTSSPTTKKGTTRATGKKTTGKKTTTKRSTKTRVMAKKKR